MRRPGRLRAAESRLGRTVNRVEDAAAWLSGCLERSWRQRSLSDAFGVDSRASNEIEWRLPALAAKLRDCERRLADFDRRLEHEKLESLKELAYGASHEINNPLANIAARAQTLLEDEPDPERQRKLVGDSSPGDAGPRDDLRPDALCPAAETAI